MEHQHSSLVVVAAVGCLQLLVPAAGFAYLSPEEVFGGAPLNESSSSEPIPIPFIPASSQASTAQTSSAQQGGTGGPGHGVSTGGSDGGGGSGYRYYASSSRASAARSIPADVESAVTDMVAPEAGQSSAETQTQNQPGGYLQPWNQGQGENPGQASSVSSPTPAQAGSSSADTGVETDARTGEDLLLRNKPPSVPSTGVQTVLTLSVLVFAALLTIVVSIVHGHRIGWSV